MGTKNTTDRTEKETLLSTLDKNSPRSALCDGVLIEMFNSLYLRL